MDDPVNFILDIVKWAVIIFLFALLSDHISNANYEHEKQLLELKLKITEAELRITEACKP